VVVVVVVVMMMMMMMYWAGLFSVVRRLHFGKRDKFWWEREI
jgi:hypothetical protein